MTENTLNTFTEKITPSTFSHDMYMKGIIPNIFLSLIIFLYIFYISGLLDSGFSQQDFKDFILISIIVVFGAQFIVGPFTNYFVTKDVSLGIFNFYTKETNAVQRTELLKKIIAIPHKACFVTVVTFIFAFTGELIALLGRFSISSSIITFICISGIQCIFTAAIYSMNYAGAICSQKAADVSKKGLDEKQILHDKFYGPRLTVRVAMTMIGCCHTAVLPQTVYFVLALTDSEFTVLMFIKMGLVLFVNSVICITTGFFTIKRISAAFKMINSLLENFTREPLGKSITLPVDLNNEISYNFFLINRIINFISEISKDTTKYSKELTASISNLSVISEKNADASVSQSDYIKESLNYMNNANYILNQIKEKITSVRFNAEKTKKTVAEGFQILKATINKMAEISDANLDTITGIKKLSEKIENVWSSINTIETIAEKTRIIAFNAELEASYAGENGEKFHIVANEIRRLASTITDSIKEIKERILAMQHSSDNLIITSEAGTQKVREGSDIYINLVEEQFNEVKLSSDITAEAALKIQKTTELQNTLFNEITVSLKEITSGFRNLSESATQLYETSHKISRSSDILTSINNKENVL